MKIVFSVLILLVVFLSGCASVQEAYKPLYQVQPEKTELKVEKQ